MCLGCGSVKASDVVYERVGLTESAAIDAARASSPLPACRRGISAELDQSWRMRGSSGDCSLA